VTLQQVHLRVNDAATGKPTPVRLRITNADGMYFAPFGRLTDFATGINQDVGGNVMVGLKKWAYIDGACEILLPPAELRVEISKGPEFKPIHETITLLPGKMSMRFAIERWSNVREQGWYSGDTRVHFLSTEGAALEGAAEDFALVHLLVKETTSQDAFGKPVKALPNILAFNGQVFAQSRDGCAVAVSTLNEHPKLGSLALLHCHRVVYPLTFGGPTGKEDWTLFDWCGQCHRKKGLVVWTNPLHQTKYFQHGEPLADLILGEVDAFELTFFEDSPFDALADYYRLLQAGLVVPLVGASSKDSNGVPLGAMRTYARVGSEMEFTYANWIEAVRAGRTFVTNGPLLDVTINGQVPTSRCDIAAGEPITIRVGAKCWSPFEHLELLWNGEVLKATSATDGPPYHAVLDHEWKPDRSGWLAVRCRGETLVPSRPAPQRLFAHSSAIGVRVADAPEWGEAESLNRLMTDLDAMLRWAKEKARCDTPAQRERLCHVFEEARTVLAKKLS